MRKQKIRWIAEDKLVEDGIPTPKPAKSYIPDWYKDTTSYYNGNTLEIGQDFSALKTIKTCMPVLDVMSAGYIQESWSDLYIEHDGDRIKFATPNGRVSLATLRDPHALGRMPLLDGHEQFFFHWNRVWNPVLPKGYSALIQHPAYMHDLPFTSLPAIVDSDQYYSPGKVGFFIKKGFQGVIPAGTPMYQIIPFKRDEWEAEKLVVGDKERADLTRISFETDSSFIGAYKRKFWSRKSFS